MPGEVETLTDWIPIPREDGIKWNRARIEGGPEREGPYTPRETIALADYPDPRNPPSFDFTTAALLDVDVWVRIVWLDSIDNTSTADGRRRDGTTVLPISTADIRDRSEFVRKRYPAEPYDAQKELDLQNAIAASTAILESLTCRLFDDSLPANLVPLAIQATVWKVEGFLSGSTAKARTSAFGRRSLKSMTAGPYSETYFGPDDAAKVKRLDFDPEMHDMLWAIATEECRDRWLELWGEYFKPAAQTTEVMWHAPTFPGPGYGRRY